jgi:hypothetical protein
MIRITAGLIHEISLSIKDENGLSSSLDAYNKNSTYLLTSITGELASLSNVFYAEYASYLGGSIPSGEKVYIDLTSISGDLLGIGYSISYENIKSLKVFNSSTTYGHDIAIYATGTDGLTGIFNNNSGNLIVKPYGVHTYSDILTGNVISSGNKVLTLEDVSGSGTDYAIVVIGSTGVVSVPDGSGDTPDGSGEVPGGGGGAIPP